jgi:hypothetical protein
MEPEPETIEYDVNYEPDELPELTKEQEDYLYDIRKKQFHPDVEMLMRTLIEDYGLKVQKAETIAKEECEKKGMSMWLKDYQQMRKQIGQRPIYIKKTRPKQIKEYVKKYDYKLVPLNEVAEYKKKKWE